MGFDLKKCGICNDELGRYKVDFSILDGLFKINDVLYENDKVYCYSKNRECGGRKMNPNSIEFISKTMGLSELDARNYIHNNNKSPFYSINHKSGTDYIKWQTRDEAFFDSSEKYENWKTKLRYGHTLESYIEKHGIRKGTKIYTDVQKSKESCSLKFYMNKYDDEEIAMLEYTKRLEQCIPKSSSIEANSFFERLSVIILEKFNITSSDIITYYKDETEFQIAFFFYDYCIKSHKIIIEYNGKIWHPNKKYYSESEWSEWKHPFNESLTADEVYKKDIKKLAIALGRGYKVITVWSDKTVEYNIEYITDKINKYLNGK